MSKEIYIEGKRFYEKPLERLSDERIGGNNVVFYKDRHHPYFVTGIMLKKPINELPKKTTNEILGKLIGMDKYGNIESKNIRMVVSESTKLKVIDIIKSNLKVENLGSVNKNNIKEIINTIIKKYGHQYPTYAYGFGETPKSKNIKYDVYYAFLPTVGGDESYQFKYELESLGFDGFKTNTWDEPYHYIMKHKKSGITISLTEGDVYMQIPRGNK